MANMFRKEKELLLMEEKAKAEKLTVVEGNDAIKLTSKTKMDVYLKYTALDKKDKTKAIKYLWDSLKIWSLNLLKQ